MIALAHLALACRRLVHLASAGCLAVFKALSLTLTPYFIHSRTPSVSLSHTQTCDRRAQRQRRQKEPTASITTRIPTAEAVDDPWLAMPRTWRVELRMATPSDEIDVRRALEKTRGVAEVLRAEPVD